MRVLIVEDSAFNAFCLRRSLETVISKVSVITVNNSEDALCLINTDFPDLVVIDGDLGADPGNVFCNGPELADVLLQKHPYLPLVVWSDCPLMQDAFAAVFKRHKIPQNEYNTWNKVVSSERMRKTWAYYFGELKQHSPTFICHSIPLYH